MTGSGTPDLPYLDLDDPGFSVRSQAVAAARQAGWCARTPYGLAVVRYGEAAALLKDRRLGQGSRRWPELNGVSGGAFTEFWGRSVIGLVGDEHARQRRIFHRAFAPRLVEAMGPTFAALAAELVDGFAARGRCDFVREFSHPYATRVICRLIGEGEDRWEELAAWASSLGLAMGVTIHEDQPQIDGALESLRAFCAEAIARRRASPPRDDTVARMLEAREDGTLSELELEETLVMMFFGGVDTTGSQLAIAMDLFLRHRDQWALLAERPELAPAAVEEVLRVAPTTTWVTREALEDFTFQDVAIARGTMLHLVSSAVGADPRAFGDGAVDFDITAPRPRHLAFGGGPHHCPGHFLARRDIAEALTVLAPRLRGPEPDGPARWLPDSGNTGPVSLPVRFTPAG